MDLASEAASALDGDRTVHGLSGAVHRRLIENRLSTRQLTNPLMTALTFFSPLRHWRSHPREAVAAVVVGLAGLVAIATVSGATPTLSGIRPEVPTPAVAPPEAPPMTVRDLAPQAALLLNAKIPVASTGPAAAPFILGDASPAMRTRALDCLTSAIYYEAGQESTDGQRGVAQVVLNRVRHPAFPNSVCGVVYQGSTRVTGCQFTFTCDNSMERRPVPALWDRARQVAEAMLGGGVYAPVGQATHYHADYVVPYWAASLVKTRVEGVHLFYRWSGGWGRPAAFGQRWSGREGDPSALRLAALAAPRAVVPVTADAVVAKLTANGAKVVEQNGRVRVRFSAAARAASDKVSVTPYVDRNAASDNLRYALAGGEASADQPAFGKAAETAPVSR